MARPIIDSKKCKQCKTCLNVCPADVFAEISGKVVVKNPDNCLECRACEMQCPQKAIKVE